MSILITKAKKGAHQAADEPGTADSTNTGPHKSNIANKLGEHGQRLPYSMLRTIAGEEYISDPGVDSGSHKHDDSGPHTSTSVSECPQYTGMG